MLLRGLMASGATAWTPASAFVSGERGLWLDPSDLATLFQDAGGTTPVTAVGQPVGRILDKSGNGNHLSQSDTGKRPTLQQDSNGKYYLQFNGATATYLQAAASLAMAPRTDSWINVAGAKFDSSAVSQSLFARSLAGPGVGRYSNHRTAGGVLIEFYDPTGSTGAQAGASDTSTVVRVVSGQVDRSAGSAQEWVNGAAFGSAASFTPDASSDRATMFRFLMGAYNDASDAAVINPLTGRIYGLVVRLGGANASGIRALLEAYMADRCGISF